MKTLIRSFKSSHAWHFLYFSKCAKACHSVFTWHFAIILIYSHQRIRSNYAKLNIKMHCSTDLNLLENPRLCFLPIWLVFNLTLERILHECREEIFGFKINPQRETILCKVATDLLIAKYPCHCSDLIPYNSAFGAQVGVRKRLRQGYVCISMSVKGRK